MGEDTRHLDFRGYEGTGRSRRAIFMGIDWAKLGKDWSAILCPRCSVRHSWTVREPKRCRCCGLLFTYTASVAKHSDEQLTSEAK